MMDRTRRTFQMPSDIKMEVILSDLPEGLTMDDIDFSVKFSTPRCELTKEKADLVRAVDEAGISHYIACFSSNDIGVGDILMTVSADIPDDAFEGGTRKDVVSVDTKITVK